MSKGRTIREFILGGLLAPTIATFISNPLAPT
ncbi:BCCT family transporter [Nitrospinaceae bacterium]|nr:BCCT family transporter [Nitrospinaceae bacterium]